MKNIFKKYFLFSFFIFIFSCSQKEIKEGSYEKASWETKAQFEDLKENHSHSFSIDIYAIKNDKIRLEVTGTLGYKVASIVLDREKVLALIPSEKKFYKGSSSQEVMAKVLKVPVSPAVFFAIIFDQGLKGPGWKCSPDAQGLVKSCQYKDSISLTWERLENPKKVVHLKTKFSELHWYFKSLNIDWSPKPEVFQLSAPAGYQVIEIK